MFYERWLIMIKKLNAKAYLVTLVFALAIILGFSTNSYAISQADAEKSPEIKVNEIKTDKLDGSKDSVKWYKVRITEPGYFRLTLGPNSDADSDSISWGWNVSLYKKGDLTADIDSLTHVTTKEATMWFAYHPDTYYIKIEPNANYVTSMIPTAAFDLKIEFNKSSVWEQEDNNKNIVANPITVNTTYTGITNVDDDIDWYKFTVTEAGLTTIYLGPDLNLADMEKLKWGWNMSIYTTDLKTEICKLERVTTATTSKEKVKLKAGTYYVKIGPNSNGYFAPDKQIYNFSVNFEGYSTAIQKTTVPGVKVKAGKKKVTVKWKKISYASGYEIYRSTKPNKGFKKVKSLSAKKTQFVDKKVKSKKKYYYKVKAYVKVNGKKYYTIDPKAKKVKVK